MEMDFTDSEGLATIYHSATAIWWVMSKLLISKVYHFSVEFASKIKYVVYAVEYVALPLKCIMFAQEFITVTPTAATHHKVTPRH